MKKIGLGIIGLGAIGERLMPVFLKHPRTKIVGVFDTDESRMVYIHEKFDIETVTSYAALIADESIDMIYIAVPPKYHHEIALKVMAAGKHVFCEKPLAGTIEEAKEMADVSEKSTVVNGMNFPLYYGYAYNQLKKHLVEDTLGSIKRIELSGRFPVWPRPWQHNNWIDTKEEGGFTREVFTHFVQLIHASFGIIENLNAYPEYSKDKSKAEIGLIGVGNIGDIKVLFNGMTGVDQVEDLNLTIYGSNGSLEVVNWRDLFLTLNSGERTFIEPEPVDATYELIDSLYRAIDGEDSALVSFKAGYETTKIIETLLK